MTAAGQACGAAVLQTLRDFWHADDISTQTSRDCEGNIVWEIFGVNVGIVGEAPHNGLG